MTRIRFATALCLATLLSGCAAKYADYGEPMKLKSDDRVSAEKVFSQPDMYNGREIHLTGKVDSVCAKKGCWLRIADNARTDTIFVKFTCPVDGRLIPMDAVGHEATIEGELSIEDISQEEARHYAEDSGKSPEEIAKIVGPQKQYRMKAPAARIYDMPKKK